MKFLCQLAGLTLSMSIIMGCGGKSVSRGIYQDAGIVSGLSYKTATQSGVTDNNGEFRYIKGEIIEFYVSNVKVGEVIGSEKITTFDLAGIKPPNSSRGISFNNAGNRKFHHAINISLFLQTLDDDSNYKNGINIPEEVNSIDADFPVNFNAYHLADYQRFDDNPAFKVYLGKLRRFGVWGGFKAVKRPGIAANSLYEGIGIVPDIFVASTTLHESSISYIGSYMDDFEYGADGLLYKLKSTNSNGDVFYSEIIMYDKNGNILKKTHESANYGGGYIENTYDQNGNLVISTNYDELGQQTQKYISIYDVNGNLLEKTFYLSLGVLSGRESHIYNLNGTLAQSDMYDQNGDKILTTERTYDVNMLITYIKTQLIGDQLNYETYINHNEKLNPIRYEYRVNGVTTGYSIISYDQDGNIIDLTSMNENNIEYFRETSLLNELGRVLQVDRVYPSSAMSREIHIYDENGNLLSTESSNGESTYKESSTYKSISTWGNLIGRRLIGPQ